MGKRAATAVAAPAPVSLRWVCANVLLLGAVLLSAVEVIATTHECRQHYALLQSLQSAEWAMQESWGQLILQEGAIANHDWVASEATRELGMRNPGIGDTRVVLP